MIDNDQDSLDYYNDDINSVLKKLQMCVPSKRAKTHKTIYSNYALIYDFKCVILAAHFASIFSHGRLTVEEDPECVYIFATVLHFCSFSVCESGQLF